MHRAPPRRRPPGPVCYHVAFRVPDRHAVFKFVLNYRHRGWMMLRVATTVSVVSFRHDGYPGFLSAVWSYYTGVISTSVGFLVFATLWLAGGDSVLCKKGKRHQR